MASADSNANAANTSELLTCAIRAASAAADYAYREQNRRHEVFLATRHDVKLRLDLECQMRAVEKIREEYPQHRIVGEEDAVLSSRSISKAARHMEFEWVVDPIDGTVNFSHGLRDWCSSVAVRCGGRTLAAVVYAPALGELYCAQSDGPALCNDKPLRVSSTAKLCDALVLTGLDYHGARRSRRFAIFEQIARICRRTRIRGAAALDICQVAAGRADAYFEAGIYLWDVAAAGLIVERAGGLAETIWQGPAHRLWFLATNGHIHGEFKRAIQRASR
ncbi:MAG: inositol monophosphatase family protein [Kiritimatiellia bacterium]